MEASTSVQQSLPESSGNNLKLAKPIEIDLESNNKKTSTNESTNSLLYNKNEKELSGEEIKIASAKSSSKPKGRIWNNVIAPCSQANDDKGASSSDEYDVELPSRKPCATIKAHEQEYKILSLYSKSLKRDSTAVFSQSKDCNLIASSCSNAGAEDHFTKNDAMADKYLDSNSFSNSSFSECDLPAAATSKSINRVVNAPVLSNTVLENSHATPQIVSYASSTSSRGKTRLQLERERLAVSHQMSENTTETSGGKGLIEGNVEAEFSDSSSQISASCCYNTENQWDTSVTSSRSGRRLLDNNSLANSMSECEDVSRKKQSEEFYLQSEKVLVHNIFDADVEAVKSFTDLDLHPDVKNACRRIGWTSFHRAQAYAFPLILNWNDALIVGQPRTGKTTSYVIPFVSCLHAGTSYHQLKTTNCPKVVIVCAWSVACEAVESKFKHLLGSFQHKIKVVKAYSCGKYKNPEKLVTLLNGCDVLITTPRYLLYLFNQDKVIDFQHLHHFILDGCHDLFKHFEPEVLDICQKVSSMKLEGKKVQIVITSEVYNSVTEKLLMNGFLFKPHVLIAKAMETAIYGKCTCKLIITDQENKIQSLLELLENFNARELKTVIVCNPGNVDKLHKALERNDYYSEPVIDLNISDEHIGKSRRSMLRGKLEGVRCPVIVCTDDALVNLQIADAHILIHFDLPIRKHAFSIRYISIFAHIPNRLVKNSEQNYCKTGVILGTDTSFEFLQFLEFIKRSLQKIEVPQVAEDVAKAIFHRREEEEKRNRLICPRLLRFGECWPSPLSCPERHVLIKDIDHPQLMPMKGYVKVKILHVLDASSYSARLLEVSEDSLMWNHHSRNYAVFATKLNMHYMDESNCYSKDKPEVGDVVVYEHTPGDFKRAKVIEEFRMTSQHKPQEYRIKLIDEGLIISSKVLGPNLLYCPTCFQEDPPYAITVYICGLKPVDLDYSWNYYASSYIQQGIAKCQKPEMNGYFFKGKILLALNSSLWLNPFDCQQYLENTKTYIVKFSIKNELLDSNFAVKNASHLPNLYELCKNAKLPIPIYNLPNDEKKLVHVEEIKPQWAHLPLDGENKSQSCHLKVYITHNNGPDMVFVQLVKFNESLVKLHNDIEKHMLSNREVSRMNYNVGDFCVANFKGEAPNRWFRAQIIDKPGNNMVTVFYVDYGQEDTLDLDQVANIQQEFITRLPFQAVECVLAALQPTTNNEWDDAAACIIDEYMMDEEGVYKTMLVKTIRIECKAQRTGGRRYRVALHDLNNITYSVNQDLLDRGFAKPMKNELLLLNQQQPSLSDDFTNEPEEEKEDDEDSSQVSSLSSTEVSEMSEIHNFSKNYCQNFSKDDLEDFKSFAFEMFSRTLNRDRASFQIERKAPSPVYQSSETLIHKNSHNAIEVNYSEKSDLRPAVPLGKFPLVLWHQTPSHLFLQVGLETEEYFIDWGDDFLTFRALYKPKISTANLSNQEAEVHTVVQRGQPAEEQYQFSLTFCGIINPHDVEHCTKRFYVHIKLKKQGVGMWQRLTQETYKLPWLKFNPNYMEDTSDEDINLKFGKHSRIIKSVDGFYGDHDEMEEDEDWSKKSGQSTLQEAEARYDMPEDPHDPTS
ncbi:unnamed protein product [Bemisia tabaci]|uniref:RNA helicase n=2 Tax=Bemisia tabaci TaxID=7038 RepID=A0A9N9ZYT9_BEMTA|nr:unnamed protein product [Bemisia tabaci]